MNEAEPIDPKLAFTVASVWREERISCPHPHLLQSWLAGGLQGGAQEFLTFHLQDSKCPYCNAVLDELRSRDAAAKSTVLEDLRDRLLRSTVAALRKTRA
ncbi:MAG: hypothetical protein JNK15_21070 [Planctomycetes bacterium]|nr:hypothetical protein [Planctomycetota bacterium]